MIRASLCSVFVLFSLISFGQENVEKSKISDVNLLLNIGTHLYVYKQPSNNSLIIPDPLKRYFDISYDFSLGVEVKKDWAKFNLKQTNFKLLTSSIGFDTFYFSQINKKNKLFVNIELGALSGHNISKSITFPNWIKNDAFYQTIRGSVFLYGGSVHYQYNRWQANLTLLKYRRYSGIGAKEHQLMLSVGYLFF